MGVLMEDMMGSYILARNTVASVKAKMTDMDNQLSGLHATFAWTFLATEQRHVRAMGVGCGSLLGGRSTDRGMTLTLEAATNMDFPIPSTIEPLFKRVWNNEYPSNQMSPPPVFMPVTNLVTNLEEGGWSCPILKEVPPP